MGKKSNTLNDLSRFLESEKNDNFKAEVVKEQDFLNRKPLNLVTIDLKDFDLDDTDLDKKPEHNHSQDKFVDSKVLRKTSFEDIQDQIKTLALENNISVQQVLNTLYYNNLPSITAFNYYKWSASIVNSYWQFWFEMQKNYFNK